MAVLLADRSLGVARHVPGPVDGHGDRTGSTWDAMAGPWPGRAEEQGDAVMHGTGGRVWVLALDDRAWPVMQGDLVVDAGTGDRWLVTWADLLRNNADPAVDYVRVEAHSYTTGTRP